jgi:hypothetical protein
MSVLIFRPMVNLHLLQPDNGWPTHGVGLRNEPLATGNLKEPFCASMCVPTSSLMATCIMLLESVPQDLSVSDQSVGVSGCTQLFLTTLLCTERMYVFPN